MAAAFTNVPTNAPTNAPTSAPGTRSFDATLQAGHKQHALGVPFDPTEAWQIAARPLWPGRRGHRVHASCGGVEFESAVVARSRRFWLLIDDEVRIAAGWKAGDHLHVDLVPAA